MGFLIPDGWVLEDGPKPYTPPAPARASYRPVADGRTAALSIYPDLQITQVERDPNSRLGRANPNSWHNRSHAAIDARPLPNMTFDDYVDGYRSAGYQIIQAIDEVHHPSRHATGPHWHVVLGGGPEGGDAPADSVPIPPGFQIEAAQPHPAAAARLLNIPPPALPGGPGLGGAARPDPALQDAVQQMYGGPPRNAPRIGDALTITGADAAARNRALAPLPAPTGYQADPNNVASQHSAPASEVPTAQTTTRDNPGMSGANRQIRAMIEDPRVSNDQIVDALGGLGVTNGTTRGGLARLLAWRASPEFGRWLRAPAAQRHGAFVDIDNMLLPEGQYREVTTPGNVPEGEARAYTPTLVERTAHAAEAPYRAINTATGGDPRAAAIHEQQTAQALNHPLSPVRAVQDASDYSEAALRARMEGRPLDEVGNQIGAGVSMLGVLPIAGRARAGAQLSAHALAELEQLGARYGIREAGAVGDAALARLIAERRAELSPETLSVLDTLRTAEGGESAPLTAAHISDLRNSANPPASIVQRAAHALRERFGGRPEPAPRTVDRIDIPSSPPRGEIWTAPPPSPERHAFDDDSTDHFTQAEMDEHMGVTPEERTAHARRAWEYFRAKEIGDYRAGDEAAALEDEGTRPWVGREQELIDSLMAEIAPPWREPDVLAMPPARSSVPAAPAIVGELPRAGVAPANIGSDGRVYVGGVGESHFNVMERHPQGAPFTGGTGFVTPDGQFLDREQALAWVNAQGENIRPSSNMPGELDALDYRDQSTAARGIPGPGGEAPIPPGWQLEDPLGRVPPASERASPEVMANLVRSIRPEDVLPIPPNHIATAEEAARANPGTFRNVLAPDPASMLEMRSIPNPRAPGTTLRHRGPLDAEAFLRLHGGIRDTGGELAHNGITNAPRAEAPGDRMLGPIINNRTGLPPDEATRRLWEAGYLPGHAERPDMGVLPEILNSGRNGVRTWHPGDLPEVADFHNAVDQQQAVAAAADAGRPLAERIGSPIGPADLAANNPPATAYEDLPRIGGMVGNINLAHIESGEDIGRLLQNVEQRIGGFDAARRGVVTHAETEALASELGMTADDLLRRRRGQALNAEQALAARQLLAKSSDEVIALARGATGPEASDVSRAAFAESLLRHAAIHEQVTGAIAEAGRALSAMRVAAKSRAISGSIHEAAIAGAGGERRLEDVAQGILELHNQGTDPGGINRFAVNAVKPRFRDKLIELWYNSLLSGPRTHAVNILSNLMTAGLQIPEHAAAAGVGLVRRGIGAALGRADDFDRVMASELGQRTFGLMQGAQEGLRAFGRTLRTGDVADQVTKVEARTQQAIGGVTGSIIRTPTRLLAAEDELFKGIGRRMELNGLAVRQARSEGLRGQALSDRIADLSTNPTEDMIARSMDYARYVTFQRPLEQGSLAHTISMGTQNRPWLKLFVPFVRTPANLLKFAVERSPAAPLLRSVRADFMAGGARRDLAAARMMLGTGLALTVADLASRGVITGGGPADPAARDLLRADGWQPYSIRIGDTYYSYARMDPLSTTMGVAADMVDFSSHMTPGQRNEAAPLLLTSIIRNLGNKTWLSGITDVVSAIDDPQRFLPALTSRLAGSIAVPAMVSQVAGVADPVMRDTRAPSLNTEGVVPEALGLRSFIDPALATIQSRVPGLSSSLPARRDVWGNEIRREGSLGPDLLSPFSASTARNDPVNEALLSIDARIGHPSRMLQHQRLAPAQYGQYQQISGRYIRDDLSRTIRSPDWLAADAGERREIVARIVRDARADARADLGLDGSVPVPAGWIVQR